MAFDTDPESEALVTCTEEGVLHHWTSRAAAVAAAGVFRPDHVPIRQWHTTMHAECRPGLVASLVGLTVSGAALAVVYSNGVVEWRARRTLEVVAASAPEVGPGGAPSIAAGISFNEACVAVVDAHAAIRIIEAPGPQTDDIAAHYARLYEAAIAKGSDYADVSLGVRGHRSAGLCVEVGQHIEARRAGRHAGSAVEHAACAGLYLEGAWPSNAAAHVLRLGVEAMLASLRASLLAPSATDVRRQVEGADENAAELLAKNLQMDPARADVLAASCQWVVRCAVLVLRSIALVAGCHDDMRITAGTLPRFIHETGAVGMGVMVNAAGADNMRELLVYAMHIRRKAEVDTPGLPTYVSPYSSL